MLKALGKLAVVAAALVALTACGLPFGLGLPSIRALNSGAAASLDAAKSFRISGSYTESVAAWKIDLELVRPATAHVLLSGASDDLEAIITDQGSYFRGQKFLSDHMGPDPVSRSLVQATGNAWWTGLSAAAPNFPDFTKGSSLASTFLGTAVTSRTDNVSVDGVPGIFRAMVAGDANASVELKSDTGKYIFDVVHGYLRGKRDYAQWVLVPSDLHTQQDADKMLQRRTPM